MMMLSLLSIIVLVIHCTTNTRGFQVLTSFGRPNEKISTIVRRRHDSFSQQRLSATRRPYPNNNNNNEDDDDYYYNNNNDYDYEEEEEFYDNNDNDRRDRNQQQRRKRRNDDDFLFDNSRNNNNIENNGFELPFLSNNNKNYFSNIRLPKLLVATIFGIGIGVGVTIDSAINTNPRDLASRDAIDTSAPNSSLCVKLGASALAFDQRVFVSFNPFNVYVAQADVKPACVLKSSNVVAALQERRHLIDEKEVRACKQNQNTWAFVGDLDNMPQLSCVYKSADAQNEFLSNPKLGIGEDVYDDDRETAAAALQKVITNNNNNKASTTK